MDTMHPWNHPESFSELDLHFGRFMGELSGHSAESIVPLTAMLVSSRRRHGDVCLELPRVAGSVLETGPKPEDRIQLPELTAWRRKLLASRVVGEPRDRKPMILDESNRLYLYRYWSYENTLAESIKARTLRPGFPEIDPAGLRMLLSLIFPKGLREGGDWQMLAAVVAALKPFCVISGGPGTGKTFAAAKILAAILGQSPGRELRVFLCAPTGKAASRLAQSIAAAKATFSCDAAVKRGIPEEGQTIHRMLKPLRGTPYFQYDAENRLPADIVVVDEASMVDLPLMAKLIQALPDDARLILMGDRNQLASVEAGSVLGDICGEKRRNGFSEPLRKTIEGITGRPIESQSTMPEYKSGIQDSILFFTRQYRFDAKSGIHALSQAVNAGDAEAVMGILRERRHAEVHWIDAAAHQAREWMTREKIAARYRGLFSGGDPIERIDCMDRFRILSAVNQGAAGVHTMNALIESALQDKGVIPRRFHPLQQDRWYSGKPVIITQNDYELGLFNGDVGVTCEERKGGQRYVVCFRGSGNVPRCIRVHGLPAFETVYAMTIHKSQGSEFDEVLLVLPDRDSLLLTRELLYTGITRARQKLSILAPESVIRSAVSRCIERSSGLRDALWR